jgi:hypothetical protein
MRQVLPLQEHLFGLLLRAFFGLPDYHNKAFGIKISEGRQK